MTFFLWNIALAVVWAALNGFKAENLAIGFALGYVLMSVTQRAFAPTTYFGKVRKMTRFIAFFVYELILANFEIAIQVLRPRLNIRPGIVALPLNARSDLEITLVANLISLTPGTLSLEVSPDKRILYVHGMNVHDNQAFVRKIKAGLEARALEVAR